MLWFTSVTELMLFQTFICGFCFQVTQSTGDWTDWITHWPGFSSTQPSFCQHTVKRPFMQVQSDSVWMSTGRGSCFFFYATGCITSCQQAAIPLLFYFLIITADHPPLTFQTWSQSSNAWWATRRQQPLLLLNILTHNSALLLLLL